MLRGEGVKREGGSQREEGPQREEEAGAPAWTILGLGCGGGGWDRGWRWV